MKTNTYLHAKQRGGQKDTVSTYTYCIYIYMNMCICGSVTIYRKSYISRSMSMCVNVWGLIKKYRDMCYKKKTKTHINSALNLLRGRPPFLKPRDLSSVVDNDGSIPGTPFSNREQRPRRILFDCLAVLEFGFWTGNVTVERSRGIWWLLDLGNVDLCKNCCTSRGHWWNLGDVIRRAHSTHFRSKYYYKEGNWARTL